MTALIWLAVLGAEVLLLVLLVRGLQRIPLAQLGKACGNAAIWSIRNRWKCWAWYFGLASLIATFGWVRTELIQVARPNWLLAASLLVFAWPAGAAVGGLIDAFVRSRRSKSDTPAITGR